MRLNQFYDALEPRSNIQRETIERLLDVLIQELNDPRHYPNYTFFAMFAGMVSACVFRLRIKSLDAPARGISVPFRSFSVGLPEIGANGMLSWDCCSVVYD
jgi:hypothetical protein